jgi:saccharopine dehydrogenase (NAD+, L-lysine-forming)
MSNVLIVGAGGVGQVVAHKCAQLPEVFSDITLASRHRVQMQEDRRADQAQDPHRAGATRTRSRRWCALIKRVKPKIVINVALPYQDLHIMDACLRRRRLPRHRQLRAARQGEVRVQVAVGLPGRFRQRGIMALLGSGFDPGVTNVYTAWLHKHEFDTIETIDILDANAGSHGQPFATNFNPEINIREITQRGRYWDGVKKAWVETDPLSVKRSFDFPEGIGPMNIYLLYHEELESIARHFPKLKRARFWMTFSENYLNHLRVLENVGMTRIDPVRFQGTDIVPIQFLKALLPDPAEPGPLTKGAPASGVVAPPGTKDGKKKTSLIYNICDHEACYREV